MAQAAVAALPQNHRQMISVQAAHPEAQVPPATAGHRRDKEEKRIWEKATQEIAETGIQITAQDQRMRNKFPHRNL